MTKKSIFLPLLTALGLASSCVQAANLIINRDNLAQPVSAYASVVLNDGSKRTLINTTQSVNLVDGHYQLTTYNNYSYGTFDIENDAVVSPTGALAYDEGTHTLRFDLGQLTRAAIHFGDINGGQLDVLYGISGISNVIRGDIVTFYLPDGTYPMGFRSAGSPFGTLNIANHQLTLDDGYLYLDNNDIRINTARLARVNIHRANELKVLTALQEVGGEYAGRNNDYYLHLTPGSYKYLTRGNMDWYGTITVDSNMTVSTDKHLRWDAATQTLSFDIESIPHVFVNSGELTESDYGENLLHAGFHEFTASPRDFDVYLPADSDFAVVALNDTNKKFGDLTLDLEGKVTVNGHLVVRSAAADNNGREVTVVGYETCGLNKVAIMPTSAARYWFLSNAVASHPATVYLPNGSYRINGDMGGLTEFTVNSNGLTVTKNATGHVALSQLENSCVPPDEDEDGLIDALDLCPATPVGAAIDSEGCSAQQIIDLECGSWKSKSHGKYMSCVARVVNKAANDGLIDVNEKGALISQAAANK